MSNTKELINTEENSYNGEYNVLMENCEFKKLYEEVKLNSELFIANDICIINRVNHGNDWSVLINKDKTVTQFLDSIMERNNWKLLKRTFKRKIK